MGNHQEIELKYGFPTHEAMTIFVKKLGGRYLTKHFQINYFFAANKKRPYLIRLRREDDRYLLTVKSGGHSANHLSIRIEEETAITTPLATEILNSKISPIEILLKQIPSLHGTDLGQLLLADCIDNPPKLVGSFTNLREVYCFDFTANSQNMVLNLECDSTTFPKEVKNYEMEIELPLELASQVDNFITAMLTDSGLSISPVASKASRFFKYLS